MTECSPPLIFPFPIFPISRACFPKTIKNTGRRTFSREGGVLPANECASQRVPRENIMSGEGEMKCDSSLFSINIKLMRQCSLLGITKINMWEHIYEHCQHCHCKREPIFFIITIANCSFFSSFLNNVKTLRNGHSN